MKDSKIVYIRILVISFFGIFFYLQDQYALSYNDDDVYHFVVPAGERNFTEALKDSLTEKHPIENWSDVIQSNINSYQNSNGRFLVHCIVQACCSFMSMDTFVVLNTLVFCIFLYVLFVIVDVKNWIEAIIGVCVLWLLVYKGSSLFGIRAFAINYLWCTVINLIFYVFFTKVSDENRHVNIWESLILCLVGVIVGSLSESFSIGFSAAYVLYCLKTYYRDRIISLPVILMVIGYLIGTAIVVFAPGNFLRADGRVSGFSVNIAAIYQMITMPINIVYLLALFYALYKSRKKFIMHVRENSIFLFAILFNALFMIIIAYNGKHQQTVINMLCLILFLKLMNDIKYSKKFGAFVCSVLMIMNIVTYIPILQIRKNLYNSYHSCIANVKDGIVVSEEYEKFTYKVRNNPFVNEYFISVMNIDAKAVSLRMTQGKNMYLIKKVIPFSPNKFREYCNTNRKLIENVFKADYNYIICMLNEKRSPQEIKLVFKESFMGGMFLRNRTSDVSAYQRVEYDGIYYYLFPPNLHYGEIISLDIKHL